MKNNIYKLALIFSALVLTTACDEDEFTGDSYLNAADSVASINYTFGTSVNEGESNTTYTYTITLSEPQIVDIHIPVTMVSGTANSDDFVFDNHLVISAFSTSTSGTITIFTDTEIEETETFTLKIGEENIPNVSLTPQTISFNIENYESNTLNLVFDWQRDVIYAGDPYHTCDYVDIDVFVATGPFDIASPWDNLIGDYDAATGDCPEIWDVMDYADGEYYFFTDLYFNGFAGAGTDTPMPITVTATQAGVFTQTFVQTDEEAFNSDDAAASSNDLLFKLTIENGEYTIEIM